MGKIATESEAKSIGVNSSSSVTTNKCCTKTRAEDLKCKITGSYTSNQLVQKEHLSQAYTEITCRWESRLTGIPVGTLVKYNAKFEGTDGHKITIQGTGSDDESGTFIGHLNITYTLASKISTYGSIDVVPTSFTVGVNGATVVLNVGY